MLKGKLLMIHSSQKHIINPINKFSSEIMCSVKKKTQAFPQNNLLKFLSNMHLSFQELVFQQKKRLQHGGTLVCHLLHTGIHGGSSVQILARESIFVTPLPLFFYINNKKIEKARKKTKNALVETTNACASMRSLVKIHNNY